MADETTDRAMAALDTMAELWAAKFQAAGTNLRGAVRAMLACPDAEDRILRLIKQGHAEGLLDGFHAGKDHAKQALAAQLAAGVMAVPAPVTVEQILNCADAYGDARIMASRGRVDRSEVDEARKELRELVERAAGVDLPDGAKR